jgi:hypothetical protein
MSGKERLTQEKVAGKSREALVTAVLQAWQVTGTDGSESIEVSGEIMRDKEEEEEEKEENLTD